jgi:hypothetical protein
VLPMGTVYEETGQQFEISDEELAELALAADPNEPIGDHAVPLRPIDAEGESLLPAWYMPAAAGRVRRDWRSRVAISMAVGIVLINACGLCITNGFPEIPW